ncbi:MAG: hypothetical protein DRR19_19010 [Candidatus Parabeggiatoa sp. nov. 1]|nr:MAG: hypothetical protein DRR19_19010 [Gammaproteobacteria bacterium]
MEFIKVIVKKILYWKWLFRLRFGRDVSLNGEEKATVILLSYKRVQNIEPITRSCLKCHFIEKVIISNHNPDIRIEDWVKVKDKRVVLINQPVRKRCGWRWVMAKEESANYFIALDDDAFIYPEQIGMLFNRLIQQPDVPHGVKGSVFWDPKNEKFTNKYFQQKEMDVDVLHQLYFVTKEHVNRYFKYVDKIKASNCVVGNEIEPVGDDIVISHTGLNQAKIHDVGFPLTCPTQYAKGIAVRSEENFDQRRREIFSEVKKIGII